MSDAPERLLAMLAPAVAEARRAWPGVALEPAAFVRHLAEQRPTDDELARLRITDLYLAAACARADPHAIRLFERTFMSQVPAYVRRVDPSPALADEVQQMLRARLLVGDATRPPAIASYTGRGALGGWVRVAAVRALHDLLRARQRDVAIDDTDIPVLGDAATDPELSLIKRRYARELNDAIQQAIAALPAVDRNVLRWHYVDGLSTDAIGTLQHVDGSTIRRKLAALRRQILGDVRARLGERLGVGASELDSLVALVRSRLELTLATVREP